MLCPMATKPRVLEKRQNLFRITLMMGSKAGMFWRVALRNRFPNGRIATKVSELGKFGEHRIEFDCSSSVHSAPIVPPLRAVETSRIAGSTS